MRPDPTALWDRYFASKRSDAFDAEARNALAEHYLPLVRYVASKMPSNSVACVERDDLISYGTFGLLDAIFKFDPTVGVKFETYAITRIRGSIIDEIRSQDWVPRSIRAKARDLDRAHTELETRHGRPPAPEEVAAHLGITIAEMHTMIGQTNAVLINLEEHTDDDRLSERDLLTDRAADPADVFMAEEVSTMLIEALTQLPERLKTLLTLTYFYDLTLAQIGQVLGVTESRVSQLQSRMLQALRDTMSQDLSMASTAA